MLPFRALKAKEELRRVNAQMYLTALLGVFGVVTAFFSCYSFSSSMTLLFCASSTLRFLWNVVSKVSFRSGRETILQMSPATQSGSGTNPSFPDSDRPTENLFPPHGSVLIPKIHSSFLQTCSSSKSQFFGRRCLMLVSVCVRSEKNDSSSRAIVTRAHTRSEGGRRKL